MSWNLSSCPLLSEPDIELIVQQFLIVGTHINGYRQTLQDIEKTINYSGVEETNESEADFMVENFNFHFHFGQNFNLLLCWIFFPKHR